MKFTDYPAQEPFSAAAAAYHDHIAALGKGIDGHEASCGEDPYQSLMVFPADKPDGSVLVGFHGGGWTNGYKEWMSFMAPALNQQGITFVSGGYRLAPQHVFPTGLDDCALVMDWVRDNISRFGGDPDKVFVSGHSAGGHYAALLAVRQAEPGKANAPIRGCAPISGVYLFGESGGMSVRPRFLGPADSKAETAASPMLQLGDRLCPFFIAYGENDFPHLKRQADEMAEALAQHGVAVQTLVLPGCDHFGAHYAAGKTDGLWPRQLRSFINATLEVG